ncbi:hypothetical protein FOA52_007752 [Chlamydomonas sp. UWO 241]|nr:hypothetical protein FOA52_007752 [Chlamydomonas sp. UWO 241]
MHYTRLDRMAWRSPTASASRSPMLRLGGAAVIRAPTARARATPSSAGDWPQEFGLVGPSKPKTAYGEQLAYYLAMEPQLFKSAVEQQLQRLKEEKEERERAARQLSDGANSADSTALILNKRMDEVRARDRSAALDDLMYVSILERFVLLRVEMLPRMDGFVDVAPQSLTALTEGIHSKEALELVREHLMGVMGPTASQQFSNMAVKMSKFQMAQVYAASIMFGYFLRRVDKRFQLERSMGTEQTSEDDAVKRLEKLFSMADADHPFNEEMDVGSAPSDSAARGADDMPSKVSSAPATSSGSGVGASTSAKANLPARKEKSALRRYVESFDQAAMVETARIVSLEGAALVERQTSAVLGDIKQLTRQIQEEVGKDVSSMEQVMERMAKAVEGDRVPTVTMTVGTQRRAVLEAVAFGSFLRDVETWVQADYNLLTPMAPPNGTNSRGSLDEGDLA